MNKPYFIIEAANCHGGNYQYISDLIKAMSIFKKGFGMKFQAFHPDLIATPDFPSYSLYQKLFFSKEKWAQLINLASKTKDIWLDIFDLYGVEVLKENHPNIHGIKFQSSVLDNYEVFKALGSVDLSKKKLILNVAAKELDEIKKILNRAENVIKPGEILLEFGYQAYPTSVEDSGISKIATIRKYFNNRIVFADHVDGTTDDALWLPVIAAVEGVDVIEKHVMLSGRKTDYDYFSSLTPERFKIMTQNVDIYTKLKEMPFINKKEKEYLSKTLMVPIFKQSKLKGSLIRLDDDFVYRRSGKKGLDINEIKKSLGHFNLLARDKTPGETLVTDDFRKAKIAVIIACRLKSTRLPKKALLEIGGLPSVERCIKSCLQIKNTDHVILATSNLEQDKELSKHTYDKSVIFHKGDPEDVIRRYLGVIDNMGIDVILRVTADMPYVDDEIAQILLKSHFLSGADYTASRTNAPGTGIEVINAQALRKVKTHFTSAKYSEYMTWYFQNNPEHFKLNIIDLPDDLVRSYRLTLDYQEDLDMFNNIEAYFKNKKGAPTARKIFNYLDKHPEIASINSHLTLRYKTDPALIALLNDATRIR